MTLLVRTLKLETLVAFEQAKLEQAEEVNKLARVRMAKHIDAIRIDAGITLGELQVGCRCIPRLRLGLPVVAV
jgi:hypothetical protein